MESEKKNKLPHVFPFSDDDYSRLVSFINKYLEDIQEGIEFIGVSITYNNDTEEYLALVSYNILDWNKYADGLLQRNKK